MENSIGGEVKGLPAFKTLKDVCKYRHLGISKKVS